MKAPDSVFHPLPRSVEVPRVLNDPFDYSPDSCALAAWKELRAAIKSRAEWRREIDEGKMFGVLVVVDRQGRSGFLAAYSGQICGRSDWEGFVPAVFDYLQPDGHFLSTEAEIIALGKRIDALREDSVYTGLKAELARLENEARAALEEGALNVRLGKEQRRQRRLEGYISAAEASEMIRQSQFQKAELRRTKLAYAQKTEEIQQKIKPFDDEIAALSTRRREMSEDLQAWLFSQFQMLNSRGESRSLIDIFRGTPMGVPPSGCGECCEPRLLQYAYSHGLEPRSMAMFWWGRSPKDVVRHAGQSYPACRGKCRPILEWMLNGVSLRPGPLALSSEPAPLDVLFDDDFLCIVNKPSGMLSVPGRQERDSVVSILQRRWGHAAEPFVVHRLDMATSGILIVAKSREMQRMLQAQFARRKVRKTYEAQLSRQLPEAEGVISLPLCSDPLNRPYQVVDHEHGKKAVTRYRILPQGRILLYPETGRTHQLRVHCAHPEGLACPIKGDVLYGSPSDRLYLHAAEITFRHPVTREEITFQCPSPF